MHAISGSTVLPFNVEELANRVSLDYKDMTAGRNQMITDDMQRVMKDQKNNAVNEMLEKSIDDFIEATQEWSQHLKNADLNNPYSVRQINDVLMAVERAFIRPEGLHERPEVRNVLYAPFKYNKYSTVVFPGMLDLLKKISDTQRSDPNQTSQLWRTLQRHISDIAIALKSAANLLKTRPL